MREYTFYKDGQEYRTENLAAFCREHDLRRSHIAEVASGMRKSYKGWSRTDPNTTAPEPTPEPDNDGGMTVQQFIEMAEVAANSLEGEHKKLAMRRIDKIRKGEPIAKIFPGGNIKLLD